MKIQATEVDGCWFWEKDDILDFLKQAKGMTVDEIIIALATSKSLGGYK